MKHDCGRELIARAIVIHQGKLLVNHSRNTKTGGEYYALPGGHVDPGESCVDALQREFTEELDATITIHDVGFISESIYPGRYKDDRTRHELVLYFYATLPHRLPEHKGQIRSPEQDKHFQWIELESLPTVNLLPESVKHFLSHNTIKSSNEQAFLQKESLHYVFNDSTRD